ncbi:MAG: hypothetical protein K2X66_17805, partial [Cyanobacteria bacterium]|nr:hypothetical protein [Cyanobacteriota bacterium]
EFERRGSYQGKTCRFLEPVDSEAGMEGISRNGENTSPIIKSLSSQFSSGSPSHLLILEDMAESYS